MAVWFSQATLSCVGAGTEQVERGVYTVGGLLQ